VYLHGDQKEFIMSNDTTTEIAFDNFDAEGVEVLETADGTALPEMGASSGSIGTSSSSSSTCSAC
jgi:thiazolylpeptide-type bacteriocin precursor